MKRIKLVEDRPDGKSVNADGRTYELLPHTFAALSMEENNPLYCVSVANNSFSIDPWKGCPLNCAYCHVQGCFSDLKNWTNCYYPIRRSRFTEAEIVEALVHHKWFIPHKSIISIGTSSTEPFLDDAMVRSTLSVMQAFVDRGYHNPFWIVTKAGFPDEQYAPDFTEIINAGNPILVSICWSNNPSYIEPVKNNRFRNIQLAHSLGVRLNWYLRPLCDEWNTSSENLEFIFSKAKEFNCYLDNITPGGLRWTEGVEFGIWAVHDQEMPKLKKSDNVKTLSDAVMQALSGLCDCEFPEKPLYYKSSCAISHMLHIPNFNFVDQFNADYCTASHCPESQRKLCRERKLNVTTEVIDKCAHVGFAVALEGGRLKIDKIRETSWQENEIVRKILSFA